MKVIQLQRYWDNGKQTIGGLIIDGKRVCYVLEDTHRDKKIKHETRIPAGKYILKFRKFGSHYPKYKERYHGIGQERGMIEITNIPNYTDVLIHIGNDNGDTSGCLLLGDSVVGTSKSWRLERSTSAYLRVYKLLADIMEGEKTTLEIIDEKFLLHEVVPIVRGLEPI